RSFRGLDSSAETVAIRSKVGLLQMCLAQLRVESLEVASLEIFPGSERGAGGLLGLVDTGDQSLLRRTHTLLLSRYGHCGERRIQSLQAVIGRRCTTLTGSVGVRGRRIALNVSDSLFRGLDRACHRASRMGSERGELVVHSLGLVLRRFHLDL